jgi:hypothetical protein
MLKDAPEKNVKETGQDIFQSRCGMSKILQYFAVFGTKFSSSSL